MLTIDRLSTGYSSGHRRSIISRDISATLQPGEFACLLGPNGAGKSTLFRTLACFIPPMGGTIFLDGLILSSYTEQELARKLSVVLTERPAVTSMTVEQLVGLGRAPYTGFWGRLTGKDRNAVEEAMTLTSTTPLRNRLVDTLSDGERQRVMIAKALAQETPLIFLDEPTAFLDFPGKVEMMRILRKLAHDKGKAILLSSHDINMALRTADTLWMLDKNLGFASGSPRHLASEGVLQQYFLREGISFDCETLTFDIAQ